MARPPALTAALAGVVVVVPGAALSSVFASLISRAWYSFKDASQMIGMGSFNANSDEKRARMSMPTLKVREYHENGVVILGPGPRRVLSSAAIPARLVEIPQIPQFRR